MKYTRTFYLIISLIGLGFAAPIVCDEEVVQQDVYQEDVTDNVEDFGQDDVVELSSEPDISEDELVVDQAEELQQDVENEEFLAQDDQSEDVYSEDQEEFGQDEEYIEDVEQEDIEDTYQEDEFEVVDQIVAIIYGQERTRIICRSELERAGIDGRQRSLPEIIFEELMYQETIKYKIPVDEAAIDKYLLTIRRQNNLSMDAIRDIFRRSGYTYQEGREQLGMMYASSTMMELKIMQRLSVTDQEVQDYYDRHPEYKEAKYQLERAFVARDQSVSWDEQKETITRAIKAGKLNQFQWGTPFWLKEDELSEFMEFITDMNCGDVSEPLEESDGFELYRLVAKRPRYLIPLEKRFREISDMLKMPKYQDEVQKYREELIANAHVVYLIDEEA